MFESNEVFNLNDEIKEKKEMNEDTMANNILLANAEPTPSNYKAYIQNILFDPNCEEILTTLVEDINKEEQMALNEENKKNIALQKKILAVTLSSITAYGDQYNLLLTLSQRLGYRKIV